MTEKHKTSGLLHALRELYLRFSKIELHRRIGLYRHNSGTNKAPDISTPLTRHIDKLASIGKQNGAPNRQIFRKTSQALYSKPTRLAARLAKNGVHQAQATRQYIYKQKSL